MIHSMARLQGESFPMKYVLLSALSLVLISNCPANADDRSSAGAATPVKLGGDTRNRQPVQTPVSTAPLSTTGATTGAAAPASTNTTIGGAAPIKTGRLPAAVAPGAHLGKGLVPPPPDVPMLAVPKKRAKRARPEAAGAPGAQVPADVTVGAGGPYTFSGKPQDQFTQTFDWQPDDPSDQLTFTAHYSALNAPGSPGVHLNWLRIMMGNQIIATERDLRGKTDFKYDMTRGVVNGVNQITVMGQGTNGALAEWRLSTPRKVKLKQVNPDEVVVGQDLALKGLNFDPSPANDTITIGRKSMPATAATPTELTLRIPKNFEPGEYNVKVTVAGLTSHEKKVIIRGIPELTGTNLTGVPPGYPLVIFGKNFSKKLADNKVMFGGTQAEVTACSTEQLTVTVPNFYTGLNGDTGGVAGQVGIPIKVKVGKIDSINSVPINVGNSVWKDPGLSGGPDTPSVPLDWRRLLENGGTADQPVYTP